MDRSAAPNMTYQSAAVRYTVPQLTSLLKLLGKKDATPKTQIVAGLAEAMLDPAQLRVLYQSLNAFAQAAISEAAHDPAGYYDHKRRPELGWTATPPGTAWTVTRGSFPCRCSGVS